MVDITAIAGTISALKGAVDVSKAIITLHDAHAIQSKVIELNGKILEAQASAFAANEERSALIEQVRRLEKEVADLKAWGSEKENYELQSVYLGAFAYVPKAYTQAAKVPHWLCATCYENGKKSILRDQGRAPGDARSSVHKCTRPDCGTSIRVPWDVNPAEPHQPG